MIKLKNTRGFTLVEMMIAMTVSLVLLLGVSQIFTSNKRSQKTTEGLARVQENARFAMKKISTDMRRAGYVGCAGDTNFKNHLDMTSAGWDPQLFDFSKGTAGWEYTGGAGVGVASVTEPGETYTLASVTPSAVGDADNWQSNSASDLPATLVGKVVPGSDVIVMKWTGDELFNIEIKGAVFTNKAVIQTVDPINIPQGTFLIISDCSGADAFQQVSNGNASNLNSAKASGLLSVGNETPAGDVWGYTYDSGASISFFISRAYYIGEGVSGEPSLFSITYTQGQSAQVVEEVAEGIENMQILYGVDTDGDAFAEKYVTGQEVADHSQVVNLKVGLIARSPDDAKTIQAARSLTLLGTTIDVPADRKIRFAFTTTVKLRNKGAK